MPEFNSESQFQRFREELYHCFEHRADAAMELLDALSSNQSARSVVELSLNPWFRREYSSLYKAIEQCFASPSSHSGKAPLLSAIAPTVPAPQHQSFYLFGLDVTPQARPFAPTLSERSLVYQPTVISGNKPITIGHNYSMLAALPERQAGDAPWTIPLTLERVGSEQTSLEVGHAQLAQVLKQEMLPWFNQLCVLDVDSAYGVKRFLSPLQDYEHLVVIARVRSNRVFYQSPVSCPWPRRRGHPTWYGERFALKDESTWPAPAEVAQTQSQTQKGRTLNVTLTVWHNLLMRGSKEAPMHDKPFTLVRIESVDETGKRVFRPMFLTVNGVRRQQLSPQQSWQSYRQRFNLEHTFRFEKQKLLLNDFQTPELEHEENWVTLVMLAYVQLWVAHSLTTHLPRPWQRYLPTSPSGRISPSKVQQDWDRISCQLGTPAVAPKPRGKSPGRQKGQTQPPRSRFKVIKKGKSRQTTVEDAA